MRIVWQNERFEAQLAGSDDWQSDMEKAKAAGFKTDGPPAWIWAAYKAMNLVRLKQDRPKILSITPEALEKYYGMLPEEEKNASLILMLKERKKEIKKVEEVQAAIDDAPAYLKHNRPLERSDIPPEVLSCYERRFELKKSASPKECCIVCGAPVYFYEQQDPPLCLWCEMHPGWPAEI